LSVFRARLLILRYCFGDDERKERAMKMSSARLVPRGFPNVGWRGKAYLLPLLVFLAIAIVPALFMMPRNLFMIYGYASFLIGYISAYRSMTTSAFKNEDAIAKLGERKPFILPLLCFAIPTIACTAIAIPRQEAIIIQFSSCFFLSLVAYFVGARVVLSDIRTRHAALPGPRDSVPSGKRILVLVNPVNPHVSGLAKNPSSRFPPLGLGILAALTPENYQVILIDENVERFNFIPCDLVGITAFTSSANRAYEIAGIYRKAGIPVVMGGIHASMYSEEAARHADAIVTGEAEGVWPELLRDFERGCIKRSYAGTPGELAGTVVPRRDIFSPDYLFATIQTSRGCPMDCYFCSVSPFNGKKYRQRPVEEVLDELEAIPQDFVFFVDDNILGYGKEAEERAIRLFKGMVERGLEKSWFCQASINFADNRELLRWAAKSGCKMVFIGLESADPEELRAMGKNLNVKREYARVFREIHRRRIAVLGAFIFGSDTETPASMVRKIDFIQKASIDVVQATVLTPLPGTRLFAQYEKEGRLTKGEFPSDWDSYNMGKLTYAPKLMSAGDFESALEKCWSRIYSRPSLAYKFLRTIIQTRSITTALWAYSSNMNYRNTGKAIE
jgi:radical SAM superfamily enzyme YgiQ (UPF0313 family)